MDAHDARLYHRLQLAAHELRRQADRAVATTGLTTAQLAVLAVIEADQPVAQRRVAEQLGFHDSAITPVVQRLERLRLVARRRHADDARLRLLELTREGRTTAAAARRAFAEVNATLDAVLAPREVDALAGALDRIRAAASAATGDDRQP